MKYLSIGIIAMAMTGCVSTDDLTGTYKLGYEDRDGKDNRYSVEPGIKAAQDDGSSVGVSYRYREEEGGGNDEHGVFVSGSIPIGVQ